MKLQALFLVFLTTSSGVQLLRGQFRPAQPHDRELLIQGYDRRVESSRIAWRRAPKTWAFAFGHARNLCKLREQHQLQLTGGAEARPATEDDELAMELREALADTLFAAVTPGERRLTAIVYHRATGQRAPGDEEAAAAAAAGLAYW